MSEEVLFQGRRGVDERGRPFESAILGARVITVARIEEVKRRGVRVFDEESGMSMGIVTQLATGELRNRVDFTETLSTCFTRHGNKGGWQEAHFHEASSEDYLVDTGHITLVWVEPETGVLTRRLLGPGDRHTFDPGVVHTVYAFAGAVTQVTRRGSSSQDKTLVPEIDALVNHLTEADMLITPSSTVDG